MSDETVIGGSWLVRRETASEKTEAAGANRKRLTILIVSCCTLLLLVTCLVPIAVEAQTETATVSGLITDSTGAIVVGAQVKLQSVDRGTVQNVGTNNAGIYVFSSLQPGQYQITVQKPGFKQVDFLGLIVNLQDHIEQNFRLQVGSVSESITVSADQNNINTTDASVSTLIDHTYVENMPLNGRSFQDLILLTPGIVTQTPQGGTEGEFSVNGQRTYSNYTTVDGVSANLGTDAGFLPASGVAGAISGSVSAVTALGTTQALVSVDDLQEFRVQSSTYSAEYGRSPGAQFAFETKSGTNQWHGTAYDYLRNGFFDAQDWFNDYFGTPEPALRQNDFGGTLGGPVEIPRLYNGKDKTFFFVSYEGLRLAQPQAATANFVPNDNLRSSAPAAVQQALQAYPVPNGPDVGNGIAEYIGSWSNPASLNSTSVRFDHVINDWFRLFFRFSDTGSSSAARGTSASASTPTVNQVSAFTMRTYTAGVTSVHSTRLSNDLRLNYSSNTTTQSYIIEAFGGGVPVNLAQLSGVGSGSWAAFGLDYDGYTLVLQQQRAAGAHVQWNFVDAVSYSLGHHHMKFGVDYRRLTPSAIVPTPLVDYLYLSQSAVTANQPLDLLLAFGSAYPLYKNFSAFAQDDWRLSQRLSLSLGLRWEVNPPPSVTRGLMPYTLQGSGPDTWTLAPQGTPLWQTTWFNFAPRLGVAYVFHNTPGRETVLRVGGGVFFDTGQQLGSQGFTGAGFRAQNILFTPFPVNAATQAPVIVNPPVPPYQYPFGFYPHLQLPYTLQWNASIEQALGKSQAFTVSYVGSHAARLLQDITYEPANNPNTTYLDFIENGLTSDYDALQVQFRRRLSHGLTALASYTFSHCIDYASGDNLLGYQRGICDFDVRHNLSSAFSYDLPDVGHNGFVNAVLHHWGLDNRITARTSFPVTLYGNQLLQPNGQFFYGGLNFIPGQPVYLYGSNCASVLQGIGDLQAGQGCPGGRAINPNAFTAATSGIGDVPRNFARGFGAWQMDLAIRRDFPIRERLKLQFRAEAFNVFNHPNFGRVDGQFGDATFGQATGTLASTLGVLSPLYQQGGPRSMQFALKLIF